MSDQKTEHDLDSPASEKKEAPENSVCESQIAEEALKATMRFRNSCVDTTRAFQSASKVDIVPLKASNLNERKR